MKEVSRYQDALKHFGQGATKVNAAEGSWAGAIRGTVFEDGLNKALLPRLLVGSQVARGNTYQQETTWFEVRAT